MFAVDVDIHHKVLQVLLVQMDDQVLTVLKDRREEMDLMHLLVLLYLNLSGSLNANLLQQVHLVAKDQKECKEDKAQEDLTANQACKVLLASKDHLVHLVHKVLMAQWAKRDLMVKQK